MSPEPAILYEDNHLLALNKPAGLPTMGVAASEPSLIQWGKQYLKQCYQKPGNVYLGVVSRVDAMVSGVVLFARTSKAAARLSEQFRSGRVEKTYWAVVNGHLRPPAGELRDWLLKDEARMRMVAQSRESPGAKQAVLRYRTLATDGDHALIEIELVTGRKHQIRVQLASRDHAILGDRKYGSSEPFASGIALHARRLMVEHPTARRPVEIVAPVPAAWRKERAGNVFAQLPE